MPRPTKDDKFFTLSPKTSGFWKEKALLVVNNSYEGDLNSLSLQDLIDFLKARHLRVTADLQKHQFVTKVTLLVLLNQQLMLTLNTVIL